MSVPYVWVPYVSNMTVGDTTDWLRIGYNTNTRDGWVAMRDNYFAKAAYYGPFGNYYYLACMVYNQSATSTLIYPLSLQVKQDDSSYYISPQNTIPFARYNQSSILWYSNVDIGQTIASLLNSDIPIYASKLGAFAAMDDGNWDGPISSYPIIYRLTNATTTGPNEAAVGDTVTVPLTFPEGYGVVNPSSDAYVTCNGVLVPSTYSDGQLVFTMPDPS